jgi:CDP-6-deoxy-D-xylo-4-hexulose-3-dehydrase
MIGMNSKEKKLEQIKRDIFEKIIEYYKMKGRTKFIPGKDRIPYAGAIFDEKEVISIVDSILKSWLGLGPKAREFTNLFSKFLGVYYTVLVNSGSSANLLALSALQSKKIKKPLEKGSEVITPAVTFPTTLNPILQTNLSPKLADVDIGTYNINLEQLKKVITSKTRAIILPHTLGNPNDMDAIMDIVDDNNLYLIEDNCDALGSEFDEKKTGSFGIMSSYSFYPAHHITMGEGGAVTITENNIPLYRSLVSLRDWGRDCWCESDEKSSHGACGKRFDWEIGGVKYDHRYIYSHIGYNLKPTEIMTAMCLEQFKKLDDFNKKRRENFQYLYFHLQKYSDQLILPVKHKKANPSWFAFPLTIREETGFSRKDIITYLEGKGIMTRLIFAGDITKQPAYKDIKFIKSESLINSEMIMKNSFFIGVYPGLDETRLKYIVEVFDGFFKEVKH